MSNTLPTPGALLDCGHILVKPEGVGTGYATTPNDFTMCYPCADEWQRSEMANSNEAFGYLAGDHKYITTWTGGELARVVGYGKDRSGFYRSEIHYVRAVAPDGSQWYGRNGGEGMSIKIKRAKGK